MTHYFHVDIAHVRKGEWRTYCAELDQFSHGSNAEIARYNAYAAIEAEYGFKSFAIQWNEV